jgi:hypothetical protein
MDEPVMIAPNLGRTNRQRRQLKPDKPDPDVERVLKEKNKCDVVAMKHAPTEEEKMACEEQKTNDTKKASKWTWVVIALAVIVVVLMIAIAWYVLKANKEKDQELPNGITHPNNVPRAMSHAALNNAAMSHAALNNAIRTPMNNVRTSVPNNPPIQTAPMPIARHEMPASKKELQETLKRMNSIKENKPTLPPVVEEVSEPKLKPSKKQQEKEEEKSPHDDNIDTELDDDHSKLDEEMAKNFNDAVLNQIEMDEQEDADEEQE